MNLHRFWDGVITSSSNLTRLRNEATAIRNRQEFQRGQLTELASTGFDTWGKESFEIAAKIAYRNNGRMGSPRGGSMDCTMVAAAPVACAMIGQVYSQPPAGSKNRTGQEVVIQQRICFFSRYGCSRGKAKSIRDGSGRQSIFSIGGGQSRLHGPVAHPNELGLIKLTTRLMSLRLAAETTSLIQSHETAASIARKLLLGSGTFGRPLGRPLRRGFT